MADKTAFELKANVNSFETGGEKLLRIETGQTYVTADPNEINALRDSDAVKEVPVPTGARAGSKTSTEETK